MKIQTLGTFRINDRVYEQSRVSCGKLNCRCMQPGGELHGPYWYRRIHREGRLIRRYIGRRLVLDGPEKSGLNGCMPEQQARDMFEEPVKEVVTSVEYVEDAFRAPESDLK